MTMIDPLAIGPSFDDQLQGMRAAPPLDLGGLVQPAEPQYPGPATPPYNPSAPGGPSGLAPKRGKNRDWLRLAMLMPVAMKQGPEAVQGLMQAFQLHQQQKQARQQQKAEEQRRQSADQRATEAHDWQRTYQQGQLDNSRLAQQQALLKDFGDKLEQMDDPAAVDALTAMYSRSAAAVGLQPGDLQTYARQRATPTRLQRRGAEKVIKALKDQYGQDKWMEMGARFQHEIGGERIAFDEVLRRAGMVTDPNAPPLLRADKRGFTPKEITLNGKRMMANFDPDSGQYYAVGDTETPLQGEILEYQRPQATPTVLVNTIDPVTGAPVQQIVPRKAGATFAVAPTAAQQTAMAEQEAGLDAIAEIERLYQPGLVGPVVGRTNKAKMVTPGVEVAPEVATLYPAVASLRNEIIRLMSGAAVAGNEATRMREQLPEVTDKPSVFVAKLQQTKRNRENLLKRLSSRTGAPARSGGPGPVGAAPVGRYNPATGKVEPVR